MLHRLFSVHDASAEAYLPPFHFPNRGQAIRTFIDTCNDAQSLFNKHPKDFTLFALGEFDDENASFNLYKTPEPIGKAIDYITRDSAPAVTELRQAFREVSDEQREISS